MWVFIFNPNINLQELMNMLKLDTDDYATLLNNWNNELMQLSNQLDQIMFNQDQRNELIKAQNQYSTKFTEVSMVTPPDNILEEHRALIPILQEFYDLFGKAKMLYFDRDFKPIANVVPEKLAEVHAARKALNIKIFKQINSITMILKT